METPNDWLEREFAADVRHAAHTTIADLIARHQRGERLTRADWHAAFTDAARVEEPNVARVEADAQASVATHALVTWRLLRVLARVAHGRVAAVCVLPRRGVQIARAA